MHQVGKWKLMFSANCCYGEMKVRFYHSSDLNFFFLKLKMQLFKWNTLFFYIWDESKYFKTLCELNKTWIASSDVLFLLKQLSSSTTVKAWAGSWRFEFSDVTLENHLYLNQLTLKQWNPCALEGFPGPSCPQQDLICPFSSYP